MGRRTKNPKIEVVPIPTKFDPEDEKVIINILADWILQDIEEELLSESQQESEGKQDG